MPFTKTSVAAIAVGFLAIGVGATWMLTRPAPVAPADTNLASAVAGDTPGQVNPPSSAAAEPEAVASTASARSAEEASRASAAPPTRSIRPADKTVAHSASATSATPAPESRPTASNRPAPEPSGTAADARPAQASPAPAAPARAPEPMFEELLVSADSVIGLRIDTAVSSETARVEDKVVATVTRDVRVGDRVAIPAGAKAYGEVTLVELGGKVKERARLGVRFTSIALGSGRRTAIETDVLLREGESAAKESAAKIGGGALGGAIIGGILGGKKGAAIGSTIGGGAGTTAVMTGGRNAATLESGAAVTVRLTKPAAVAVER